MEAATWVGLIPCGLPVAYDSKLGPVSMNDKCGGHMSMQNDKVKVSLNTNTWNTVTM